jgi:hypothetical protein
LTKDDVPYVNFNFPGEGDNTRETEIMRDIISTHFEAKRGKGSYKNSSMAVSLEQQFAFDRKGQFNKRRAEGKIQEAVEQNILR